MTPLPVLGNGRDNVQPRSGHVDRSREGFEYTKSDGMFPLPFLSEDLCSLSEQEPSAQCPPSRAGGDQTDPLSFKLAKLKSIPNPEVQELGGFSGCRGESMGSLPGKGKVGTSVGGFIVDGKHLIGSSKAEEGCLLGLERSVQKAQRPSSPQRFTVSSPLLQGVIAKFSRPLLLRHDPQG